MGATLIWQGFDFGWIARAHAFDRMAAIVDEIAPGEAGAVTARFASRLGHGEGGDAADADVCLSTLSAPWLGVVYGTVSTRIVGKIAASSTAGATVVGPVAQVCLPFPVGARLAAAPLLGGFSLEGNRAPQPIRGFGFRLIEPSLDGNRLSFRPEYFVHAAGPPGADYDFTASLSYTVVAAPAEELRLSDARHESHARTPHESLLLRCAIDGRARGYGVGTVGLRGFRWQLDDDEAPQGRLLRRLHLAIDDVRYQAERGRVSFAANLHFGNRTPGAPGFGVRYLLEESLLQLASGRAPVETRLRNELGLASGAASLRFSVGRMAAAAACR